MPFECWGLLVWAAVLSLAAVHEQWARRRASRKQEGHVTPEQKSSLDEMTNILTRRQKAADDLADVVRLMLTHGLHALGDGGPRSRLSVALEAYDKARAEMAGKPSVPEVGRGPRARCGGPLECLCGDRD